VRFVPELPTGTVTFLFTDLEGSTRLWEEHREAMKVALARHDEILRDAIEGHGGYVIKGMGDGLHAVFATADEAVAAAVAGQRGLVAERWGAIGSLRVRMGLHTGVAEQRRGDYFGPAVNRAARLMSIAHGGQIVLSHATEQLTTTDTAGVELVDLGEHRLRDLGRPERVFEARAAGLAAAFPPLRSLDHLPGELPVFLTSFVGREREIRSVVEALGQSRLVTVIGVGGVGKTRLAVEATADAWPTFGDGAWFCDLAAVTDRQAVPDAVAACLGVSTQQGGSVTANVLAFLRHKHLVVVLDNCEHLVDAVSELVEAITHACAQVTILATSREALGIDGEVLRPLGPLRVPEGGSSPGDLAESVAVRLFVDRALAVRPDLRLDEATLPVVGEICRRLDGVPLALELAAARVASLSISDIAERLDQRFRLLTGGRRTALGRHQTLRAAVDWSYDLLDESQRRVFDRLGVFVGGFDLEAAETVVLGDGVDADRVLELLADLVARSMLVADDSGARTRFRLHETMRQYAVERLEASGRNDEVRRRHAEHYIALAELVTDRARGPDEQRWVQTLDLEFGNMAAAFDWATGVGDADLALRLPLALFTLAFAQRPRYRLPAWNERALALAEAQHHPLRPHLAAAATIDLELGDVRLAEVEKHLKTMDAVFAEAGRELTSVAHEAHATFASVARRWDDEAERHAASAIELSLAAGDRYMACVQCAIVAMFLATSGDDHRALPRAEQSIALAADVGAPSLLALSETALGYCLVRIDPEAAVSHLERGHATAKEVGSEVAQAASGRWLAHLLCARGDLVAGLELHSFVLERALEIASHLPLMLCLESLAVDLAAAGHAPVAATLLGALEAPADRYQGNPLFDRPAVIGALRRAMGEADFEACAARGRAMDTDQLGAFARSEITRIADALHAPRLHVDANETR
jgi:predicted ATPase/class 3 adenylate cyclase